MKYFSQKRAAVLCTSVGLRVYTFTSTWNVRPKYTIEKSILLVLIAKMKAIFSDTHQLHATPVHIYVI